MLSIVQIQISVQLIHMGKLSFENKKFYFTAMNMKDDRAVEEAKFSYCDDTLRWVTRNAAKAVKLRRFADASAELKLKNTFITSYAPPECIPYPDHLEPKLFQLETAWHCLTRSPAYNADEAGLGKTIESILCMNAVKGRVLIICPPHLKYNWLDELRKWLYDTKRKIAIIEGSDQDQTAFEQDIVILPDSLLISERIQLLTLQQRFTWLFVDEAHRYKEATTKRTVALVGDEKNEQCFRVASERFILLSGTPIPNGRPMELYHMLSRVAPEAIGHRNKLDFGKYFCNGHQVTRHEGQRAIVNWDFSGASRLKTLRRSLRDKLMIRHLKKDVLKELGPKTRQIIFLDEQKKFHPMEKRILKNYSLDELMGEDHELGDIATYRREVGEAKTLPAFTYINDLLENSTEKLVVFAHHISVVETLHRMLEPYGALMIRGGMGAKKKSEYVKMFQTQPFRRVIVGNWEAMGVGNTLTKAPRMIAVEPSWVPGINEQGEDRVYRMTQTADNVYCTYLVLRNSLDERMLSQVLGKQQAINEVMD